MREAVVLWSGGIDSTAVLIGMLDAGWDVRALSLDMRSLYGRSFSNREAKARRELASWIVDLPTEGRVQSWDLCDGSWLTWFQRGEDQTNVPRRNKLCIDWVYESVMRPRNISVLGLGEYVGCDTWVEQDHVPARDCDARSLESYVFQ